MGSREDVQQLRDRVDELVVGRELYGVGEEQLAAGVEAVLDLVDRADADGTWLVTRSALVAELRKALS